MNAQNGCFPTGMQPFFSADVYAFTRLRPLRQQAGTLFVLRP
ncbi:hypothetical protein Hsw_0427 [Hymenobacter swuensis DY53]|uniref:Uncharacterized protein n=1 Tax=Hymenobacter swuensis DY53 TaxID=1227739 RepID=W8EW91_9BACT|nr:hypothetical protein Hsw_0427 [Hymenobacter swuensis DY53]